ncbi:MAG: phasin family protein [Janthinobacterium lividum]
MDDLFKKFINTGVGFLSQGNKAVQTAIEKLVKESKISEQEGKKIVDDLLKSSESKRTDLEKQFKGLTEDLRNRVSRGADGKPKPTPPTKAKTAAKSTAAKAAPKAPTTKKAAASAAAPAATTAKKPRASAAKKAAPAADSNTETAAS